MAVPQEGALSVLADVKLESEDELADDLAEDEYEQERAALESATISPSSPSSSSSSCATIAITAADEHHKDRVQEEGRTPTQESPIRSTPCDTGQATIMPLPQAHTDAGPTVQSLSLHQARDPCIVPERPQSQTSTPQPQDTSLSQRSEPSAPPLFRGQDEDNSEDEVGRIYAVPQPPLTSAASNPSSLLLSPPQEETSLHTYGPSSFTPKRRIFVNAVSRKYGKIRGVEDDEGAEGTEDVRARARLATSPPTPTTPVLASVGVQLPTTPPNRPLDGGFVSSTGGSPSHTDTRKPTSPLAEVVAPRLPLNESQASGGSPSQQARKQCSASPEFEMTGQRRVGMGEDTAGPCASPSQKLCIATKGLHLSEAIEISSASDTTTGGDSASSSDSEDCVECDAEGNVLLRTPAVIADEIQRRALAGMARLTEAQRTPTKSRVKGKQSPVKAELKSPSSASKRRKVSPPSTPSGSKIKRRYDSSSDEGRFGEADDDKSLVAGPSTPSKRRRRPHEGPKRVLPEWHQWEDLLIMHEASQGKLGSAGNILGKINEKRAGQGLELREAQDVRNRWAKLKATMQDSVVALHRSF